MAKEIPLTQGKVAIVDDADFEWLSQYKWCYAQGKASRGVFDGSVWRLSLMHREIMQPPAGYVVDHKNRNGIDNQRSNLRICTPYQNRLNSKGFTRLGALSFKGVKFHKRNRLNPWQARITHNHESISLGYFATAEEAAIAYNKAAIKYHGEFACLNAVDQD